MAKAFRFGVQIARLSAKGWVETVRELETLGYGSALFPDHFIPQWDPIAGPAMVAAVTEKLRVGTLVYGVDYRHPVTLAMASATIHRLSGGRFELGMGAGWMQSDYAQAGLPYDSHGTRIRRLDEALTVIKKMWSEDEATFEGEHYRLEGMVAAARLKDDAPKPKILIGGGRPKILGVAGKHADIVGLNPSLHAGKVTSDTAADIAPERVAQKREWVRAGCEAAGRDFDALEFNTLSFVTAVVDDPQPLRAAICQQTGMTTEQVANCPLFLTGSGSEIRDTLERRRDEHGVNYVVIQYSDADSVRKFAEEVIAPLAGR